MTRSSDAVLWERWEEVDRLLDRVLDLPPAEQRAFLAKATGSDHELRDTVARLLDQLAGDPARLQGPSESLVLGAFSGDPAGTSEPELEAGTIVGRYVIVGFRGRGGMATVYEARRDDGAFDQRVAIKVLRRGLDTDDLVARFRAERQILSSLTHANVARLLDGGALADGRPYLVMELVDGAPITTYADDRCLPLRERLALFIDVANAVHAAHRQLVVHRDIKPSNILVSPAGEVKLLDFGIAKLLDAEGNQTGTGVRLLTPDYASPEQLRGDKVTTSSDIYQLGLLLRELLTGLSPLAGDSHPGEPPLHASRIAALPLADLPDPAGRARARGTTPAALSRALRGDLDILVGKALRADPEQRYASAEEMAEDVRRYLSGRPVSAHPESTRYLLRKFLARNRWVVPTATMSLLALVVFVAVLTLQNRRLQRERDAARMASERAQATEEFLVQILRSPDPTGGTAAASFTVVEALQLGRQRVDVELADQPAVRASVLAALGNTFAGLGRTTTADSVLRQALALAESVAEPNDERTLEILFRIGVNYRNARRSVEADSVFRALLELRQSSGALSDAAHATLLAERSATFLQREQADSALDLASRAAALLRMEGDTLSGDFTGVLNHLAPALRAVEQFDSAETVYGELLRRFRAASPPNKATLAVTLNNIGLLQKTRGDLPAAVASYREALQLAAETYGPGHPQHVLLGTNLASSLEPLGAYDQVETLREQLAEATERYWPNGDWRVGAQHLELGRFFLRRGQPLGAITPLQRGWQHYVRSLGERHAWTVVAEAQLGLALLWSGRADEGRRHLDRSYDWVRGLPEPPNAELRDILQQLAQALENANAPGEAARFRALIPAVP